MMKLIGFSTYIACVLILLETKRCISELELTESKEGDELDHECSVLLNAFANSASNFTHCAVKNAWPFRFCCMCSVQYSRLIKRKNDIYENCFYQLVSSQKYQIVERMFQFANTLWYTSHCDGKHDRNFSSSIKILRIIVFKVSVIFIASYLSNVVIKLGNYFHFGTCWVSVKARSGFKRWLLL